MSDGFISTRYFIYYSMYKYQYIIYAFGKIPKAVKYTETASNLTTVGVSRV